MAPGCHPYPCSLPPRPLARLHSLAPLHIGCGHGTGCRSQKGNGNDCCLCPPLPPTPGLGLSTQTEGGPSKLPSTFPLATPGCGGRSIQAARTASSVLSRVVTWKESEFSLVTMCSRSRFPRPLVHFGISLFRQRNLPLVNVH